MRYGNTISVGLSTHTIIADMDFETYSPAGYEWCKTKFEAPKGASTKKGLFAIGVMNYVRHPEAEVLCLAYDLKDGEGQRLWYPELNHSPVDLFKHLSQGLLVEAWNCSFEEYVWNYICVKKYGWPKLNPSLLRCAMAKSRAYSLPGSLENAGEVLNLKNKKMKEGKKLLDKFSIPHNPTKKDIRTRVITRPWANPEEFQSLEIILDQEDTRKLYGYCIADIASEAEASSRIPDLSLQELEFWTHDREINRRGIQIDLTTINKAILILEEAQKKYLEELKLLTNNEVNSAHEISKLLKWVNSNYYGIYTLDSLIEEKVSKYLEECKDRIPPKVKRVLEIRQLLSSAAVKKLYAMKNQATSEGRIHELLIYHSARTGRSAGSGVQPQNLPNSGIEVIHCDRCKKRSNPGTHECPWCGNNDYFTFNINKKIEWDYYAAEDAISVLKTADLNCTEYCFTDAISTISSCLRSMFIAKSEHDLICSDYSAIEAVVLAALAGEEWRLNVFRTHGKIYEMSTSKITGIPFQEFEEYYKKNGSHHPLRKKIGKVAELASGYQGWIGAWKNFKADQFFNDDEIKQNILAWRAASPSIVEMWGGQLKYRKSHYYGLEGNAILSILNPGRRFNYRGIEYLTQDDVLYCRLLSGRHIVYHRPRLKNIDYFGNQKYEISFEGWNTNQKYEKIGWSRMTTYGGKLTENVVQATARDILTHAIVNLQKASYPIVLHVHDEILAEVPKNYGSIEDFEKIMSTMPEWAKDWPVKAKGGWRGNRYRK